MREIIENILTFILLGITAAIAAVFVAGVMVAAVIVDNFKWVMLCGTALIIASWFV